MDYESCKSKTLIFPRKFWKVHSKRYLFRTAKNKKQNFSKPLELQRKQTGLVQAEQRGNIEFISIFFQPFNSATTPKKQCALRNALQRS